MCCCCCSCLRLHPKRSFLTGSAIENRYQIKLPPYICILTQLLGLPLGNFLNPRLLQMKGQAGPWHQRRLLRASLCAWHLHTQNKLRSQRRKLLAVRHAYLAALRRALRAWQGYVERRGGKRRRLGVAAVHWTARVLGRAFEVREACGGFGRGVIRLGALQHRLELPSECLRST